MWLARQSLRGCYRIETYPIARRQNLSNSASSEFRGASLASRRDGVDSFGGERTMSERWSFIGNENGLSLERR